MSFLFLLLFLWLVFTIDQVVSGKDFPLLFLIYYNSSNFFNKK
jgi:hypothetical protein